MTPYAKRWIAKGLCGNCGKEPLVTPSLGETCLVRARERARLRRFRQRLLGLCMASGCNSVPATGKTRCQVHLDRAAEQQAAKQAQRQQAGLCVSCGKLPPRMNRIRCEGCLSYNAEFNKQCHHRGRLERLWRLT